MKRILIGMLSLFVASVVYGQGISSPNANQATNAEETVYVTKTGAKYHKAGCRYLAMSSIPVALSKAKLSYTPCSICYGGGSAASSSGSGTSTDSGAKSGGNLTGETTPTGIPIYEGPRGGRYHYSKSGNKIYERKK